MTSGAALRVAVRRMVTEPKGVRRYLAPGLSLDDFFDRLNQAAVCYVVLRWFDTLPDVGQDEDVDLLIADEDLAFVRSLMAGRATTRHTQKFDLYSAGGLPGSDFQGVPYYPPHFAQAVLDTGVMLRDRYRVPDLQHHYDSLAYHAVYHKGHASGLRAADPGAEALQPSDHDYEGVLTELGTRLGAPLEPTLDNLDSYLARRGLRPPLDTLERLEPRNPWIRDRFFAERPEVDDLWRGLAVFVLRERAATQVDLAVRELDRHGFELLSVVHLDPTQQAAAARRLRGGNWGHGPWPLSGGDPVTYLIAYDVAPDLGGPDAERADNLRIPPAKRHLRDRLLQGVAPDVLYNPVHSSDNPHQALDYLEALDDPGLLARLAPQVRQLVAASAFPFPVLRSLASQRRRAQVAVVDHPVHGPSVCKVFRPGAARFFERELRARTELADLPEMPDLLDSGASWVVTTNYADDGSHVRRRLPGGQHVQLSHTAAQALALLATRLHERGLFLLDLSTHNLVSDPVAGLKVLDLEFLQDYREPTPQLADAYTFRGVPDGVHLYDLPLLNGYTRKCGGSAFHPAVTGSPVEALLRPRRPLDALGRELVQLRWYLRVLLQCRYKAARRVVGATGLGKDVRLLAKLVLRRSTRA